ncbi:MAG TPA: sugar ABC transporter permease [Stellaceae bacterium]|jgi:multiple sugar transport system permease protein|nr:sugar ABC transporter permease [Stellaceae bacterium]
MSSMQQVLGARPAERRPKSRWHAHLHGSDLVWAIAFLAPYAAVFLGFVVYPIGFALWLAARPSLYAQLWTDPIYRSAVVNTLLFVGVGVNVKMFGALLLSGFFMRRDWWVKAILVAYILPWLAAATQAFMSVHWMLIDELGLVDRLLSVTFGVAGLNWLDSRWLALACNITAYVWKWMPFWTLILLAGRMAIPPSIYDAAEVDGATGIRRFTHVTFPLVANLYLVCTLLSTLWTFGDFATVYFVSGGGPLNTSQVLTTLGFHYAFDAAQPGLGVAVAMSALPLLIPVVIVLMRWSQASEGEL